MSTTSEFNEYRPIPYLGGKWRLLGAIQSQLGEVWNPKRPVVCDPFSGSGVVSRMFAERSFVISGDVQEYSRILTSSMLRMTEFDARIGLGCLPDPNELDNAEWLNQLSAWELHQLHGPDSTLLVANSIERGPIALRGLPERWTGEDWRLLHEIRPDGDWTMFLHYGGVYFSYTQAAELDLIARRIRHLDADDRDSALAALLGVAIEIANSVGNHFAQPVRPRDKEGNLKIGQLTKVREARLKSVRELYRQRTRQLANMRPSAHGGRAHALPYEETLAMMPASVGLVYADPPYTRDHYSRFYHVLETIALGDNPGIAMSGSKTSPAPSRGLYRVSRHQSPFSVASQAPKAFASLFESVAERDANLMLSYSPLPANEKPRARVMSMDALTASAKAYFKWVKVVPISDVTHSKFNRASLNASTSLEAEVLILAQN